MPKISVILPFFNSEKTIERAILSIINQSFTDFECILIDNNSTDKSREIAIELTKNDNRFIITEEETQGVVYASNKGSTLAKGEYIARMDADDECYKERLSLQSKFLNKHTEYSVVSGMIEYVGNNSSGFAKYVQWVNSVDTYEKIILKRFIESPIINPSAMWRKEIAQQYGMYNASDLPEDYELWLRWLDMGVKIGKVKEKIIKWYDSPTRLTRTDIRYSNDAFYKTKSPFIADYIKKNKRDHKIAIWGASRISRRRAELLTEYGIESCCYIDITQKRKLEKQILFYKDIPKAGQIFILVYVRQQRIRKQIEEYLNSINYIEGIDYLLVS